MAWRARLLLWWQNMKSLLVSGRASNESDDRVDGVLWPSNVEEVQAVVHNAYKRGLGVRCAGAAEYGEEARPGETAVSLHCLDKTVSYDALNRRYTVEGGARLGVVLRRLQDVGLTLPLHGTLPDIAIADAVSIGLLSSQGAIGDAVESCEVVAPTGERREWHWRGVPELLAGGLVDPEAALFLGVPESALESLLCGLGHMGIITKCTLRCQELRLVCERSYTTSLDELLENGPRLCDGDVHVDIYWFPVLEQCVVVIASPSKAAAPAAAPQPRHLGWAERALWGLCALAGRLAQPCCSYWPRLARPAATLQCTLLLAAASCRAGYRLQPQRLVPSAHLQGGARWWAPRDRFATLLQDLRLWLASRRPHEALGGAPVWLAVPLEDSAGAGGQRQAYLSPQGSGPGVTLWCDFLRRVPRIPGFDFNWVQEELEAIFHRHGGRSCWGTRHPVLPRAVAKQFPRLSWWQAARRAADPLNMLESVYVCGELG